MKDRSRSWIILVAWMLCASALALSCKSSPPGPEKLLVGAGMKVTIEYTISLADKTVAVSNVGQPPFSFIQGKQQVLPFVENALAGMAAGEKKVIPMTSDQAFGPYDAARKVTVRREQLPREAVVGANVRTQEGHVARIVELTSTSAVLDFNHPLAGKDLIFDVTVLNVERP